MTVAVVISTLNEADNIGRLVGQLIQQGHHVIVCDGGSSDLTTWEAEYAGAEVIDNGKRLPIGSCLMWGFDYAGLAYDRYVQMDAGGSHDPADLPSMLKIDADVVIGSRFVKGSRYIGRPWRKELSRFAGMMCNLAQSGMGVKDWTSGYRVYSKRAIDEILRNNYRTLMHTWQIETLARCGEAGLSIVEVPITYRAGRSSANLRTAGDLIHVWLHMANHIGWRPDRNQPDRSQGL